MLVKPKPPSVKPPRVKKKSKKSGPRVKESEKTVEDETLEDSSFDNLVGGAVLAKKTKHFEAETKKTFYGDLGVTTEPFMSYSVGHTNPFLTFAKDALSFIPENHVSFDQMEPTAQAVPEKNVYEQLIGNVSGKGAQFDHPIVARAIFESLKAHPKIAHLYASGRVHA